MKRRTLRQVRQRAKPEAHHCVYVVLLDPAVAKLRKVRAENPGRDPAKPGEYVGMSGLTPEERFANHRAGHKAAGIVMRYGVRLLPELYTGGSRRWWWTEPPNSGSPKFSRRWLKPSKKRALAQRQ